ncbi:hypothetical protein TNCV_5081571 [Trichonephila clavipes]|nr:hypothetical protein TNCV_5081571 [Trichonephila clavipes]
MNLILLVMFLNGIRGFPRERVSVEDDEPAGRPRNPFYLNRRGLGKNGEFPDGTSNNLVPELLSTKRQHPMQKSGNSEGN